jgi:hypothetical protein
VAACTRGPTSSSSEDAHRLTASTRTAQLLKAGLTSLTFCPRLQEFSSRQGSALVARIPGDARHVADSAGRPITLVEAASVLPLKSGDRIGERPSENA